MLVICGIFCIERFDSTFHQELPVLKKIKRFLGNAMNRPQFFSLQARDGLRLLLVLPLLIPLVVGLIGIHGATLGAFRFQAVLVVYSILSTLGCLLVFFVLSWAFGGKEHIIVDAEEVLSATAGQPAEKRGSLTLRALDSAVENRTQEIVQIRREDQDIGSVVLTWRTMSSWRRVLLVTLYALGVIFVVWGAYTIFFMPPLQPIPGASDELNRLRSPDADVVFGALQALSGVVLLGIAKPMLTLKYYSRSKERLNLLIRELSRK